MAKIKLRRDTYTNWFNVNPILAEGEPALDTTNNKVKYGNGVTPWKDLPYADNTSSAYTLPPATETVLGGIKVGNGLLVTLDGTLSVSNSGGTYTLITATNSVLGGVKIGNGIAASGDGTISVKFPLNAGQPSPGQPVLGGNSDIITLYNFNDNARVNYAIGYETNYMWFATESALSGVGFKWYSGTDEILKLDSNGTIYLADGTTTITSTKVSNWDSAYSWGNHALAGYLTTVSQITVTETDPIFSTSTAATITATNVSNWDTAYGWGNHATRGYTTASVGALTLTGNSIKGNDYNTGVLLDYSFDAYTLNNESEAGDYIFVPYNSTSSQITAGWVIAATNTTTTVSGTLYPMAGREGMIRVNLTNPTSPDRVRYPLSIRSPIFGPQIAEVVIQPSSTVSNIKFVFSSSGVLATPGSIIPDQDVAYDLGSSTKRWRDLYLSTSTIYLGDTAISVANDGNVVIPGSTKLTGRPDLFDVHPDAPGSLYWPDSNPVLIDVGTMLLAAPENAAYRAGWIAAIYTPSTSELFDESNNLLGYTISAVQVSSNGRFNDTPPDGVVLGQTAYSTWAGIVGSSSGLIVLPPGTLRDDWESLWSAISNRSGTLYANPLPGNVSSVSFTVPDITLTSFTNDAGYATESYVQQAVAQGGGGNANTGNITFDNEIISAPNGANILMQAKNSGGNVNSLLELNSEFAVAKLTAKSEGNYTFYSGSDFTSATWEPYEEFGQQRSRLTFVGATSLHDFISNNLEFGKSGDNENGEWTVDGINFYPWPYSTGWAEETGTLTVEFYDAQVIPPPESTVTVETFALRWINESKVAVDLEDYSQLDIVGVGVDVKVESTRSINVEAGDGVNVLAANNLNLESVNGTVKIAAAIYSNNSQWTFSPLLTGEGTVPAKITFPDNTFQTTAWAGGRVVPAPSSSLGASGDKAEDIAFNSDYFYYCIADYTDGSSTIWKRVAWSIDDNW